MVVYEEETLEQDNSTGSWLYNNTEKTKAFLSAWMGVILTIVAMITIFIVAAVEGTKEVKAPNVVSGRLLTEWRVEQGVTSGFPEERTVVMEYKNKEYYFIVEEYSEEGDILKWYWAYDAGLDYIFGDYKYYVLVAITLMFSVAVSSANYNSTLDKVISTPKFTLSLIYYQKKKDAISKKTHLLPKFCIYKNKQTYEQAKMNLIQKADIDYDFYLSKDFDKKMLSKWQKRQLRKIKKIKLVSITPSDLLQEKNFSVRKIRILPESQSEHKRRFILTGLGSKLITTAASGMVAGFGIVIGDWVLGLVFGSSIVISAIGAIISAADYGTSTLKNRFISKGDLLQEFDNISDMFIEKKAQVEESKKVEEKNEVMIKEFSPYSSNLDFKII